MFAVARWLTLSVSMGSRPYLRTYYKKARASAARQDFAEAIASVGGELGVAVGLESVAVSASFMAKDAALMVELVSDMLLTPLLDPREFGTLRDRSINLIKAAKGSNPGQLMPSYANAFLFGNHPYGNPVGGSESSLARITHGDLIAYYADMVGSDRLIVSVSGDFEVPAMKEALTAAFGDWRPAMEPLQEARGSRYLRTAAVFSSSINRAQRRPIFTSEMSVSRVAFPGVLSSTWQTPFSAAASHQCL